MTEQTAEDQLRTHTRAALEAAGLSQAEVARQLGVSTKHLCRMLTGHATLTLTWAEGILGLAGHSLVIRTRPDPPDDVREQLLAALRGEAPAIICATKCEPCMYGQHYPTPAPHPWAGPEDIAHAAETGQPEPTGNCGCTCARTTA